MRNFLLLTFIFLTAKVYSQSPVSDFQYDINRVQCDQVLAHFYFEGSIPQDFDSCYWYFGDGVNKFSDSSNSALHYYTVPGIYSVELVLWKDSVTSSIKKDSIITVFHPPLPSFSYEVSDTLLFAPLTVNFFNNTQRGDGDSLVYLWEVFEKDTIYSEEDATITFDEPGTYSVNLIVSDEMGCEKSYSDYITVKDTAQRGEFDLNLSECYGDSEIPPCGYDQYFEIIDDTLVISGFYYGNCGTRKTATVNFSGDTVVVKTWQTGPLTTCGCGYCFEIKVPDIYTDSVLVNFNNELKTALVTGNRETLLRKNKIQVYPNPANDVVNFSCDELSPEALHYEITNLQGVIKQTGNLNPGENSILLNKQQLSNGFYLLIISESGKRKYIGKLLIN